jgi:hypothetical protein
MKINEWTLGLAAVGVVSLASVAQADEVKLVPVMTALNSTTLSGYVDTSATWNPGSGNANPAPYAFNAGKQDGFNLNLVDVKISKPLDEGKLSAGYTAELVYGADAPGITGSLTDPIREAHVDLSIPIGNGLDFEVGRFGNVIGYESTTSYLNPNYTHSYAWSLEPTEHTGVLASYKFCDAVSFEAGVANTLTTGPINARNVDGAGGSAIESKKAVVSLLTLTAPDSFGFAKGSAFYAGLDHGPGPAADLADRTHLYLGGTLNTPIKELTVGASFDSIWHTDIAGPFGGAIDTGYTSAYDGYVSYKLTDKATLSARGEYVHGHALGAMSDAANGVPAAVDAVFTKVVAGTLTFDYALWANVTSRLEARLDHAANGSAVTPFGGTVAGVPTRRNELMVSANVIYKF